MTYIDIPFIETSAKQSFNVDEAMRNIGKLFLTTYLSPHSEIDTYSGKYDQGQYTNGTLLYAANSSQNQSLLCPGCTIM